MREILQKITESIQSIREYTKIKPELAIILGTGLGRLAEDIENSVLIPYDKIKNFPISTVPGHSGNLVMGKLEDKLVVAMQGRFHYYEGYSMQEITFPVRVMRELGAKIIIISNASGGMNRSFQRGDLMLIYDHINLMGDNPLIGPNDEKIGPRFPDMSEVYDKELISLSEEIALKDGIKLHKGVYAGLTGPMLETPAEYRMLIKIGADAVGMSTIPEVIVANHMNMRVLGISCITDLAIDGVVEKVHFQEILDAAAHSEPLMTHIVKKVIKNIVI
ncbi:MAG: purine-nucleoside phosphorylase [Atribacterota bacterium]|nr:purine-nucleoside phosphorylase [Atribacterota bacterium]MDD4895210.1 purine-nucleoside phosphorylase [Atribacterota bacterium]MDD5636472.1 purine-nucleoside phosphorylase [Atribacterota bacterium]